MRTCILSLFTVAFLGGMGRRVEMLMIEQIYAPNFIEAHVVFQCAVRGVGFLEFLSRLSLILPSLTQTRISTNPIPKSYSKM